LQIKKILIVIGIFSLYFLLLSSAPSWPFHKVNLVLNPKAWVEQTPYFVLFFFLSILPFINAVSDYISVGLTRFFIVRYRTGAWGWWVFWIVDIVCAIVLTLLIFLSVLGLLEWVQYCGWGVDAKGIRTIFFKDPWNPEISWITLMAATNLLPTLAHLITVIRGTILGSFVHSKRKNDIEIWSNQLLAGESLTTRSASELYNCLYIDRRMSALVTLALLVTAFPLLQLSVWYSLRWLF